MRFGKKGKLSPRFMELYDILERIALVAYQITLPPELEGTHDVFHVSMLRKCIPNPTHVLTYIPRELDEDVAYMEYLEKIVDQKDHVLRNLTVSFVKSRQKSYADARKKDIEFQPGEKVFLMISPTKGLQRFHRKGKLSPRYIGPFEILSRVGSVAYMLALPPSLGDVHNVFHVSMLKRYVHDPSHVLPVEPEYLEADMTYTEQPAEILDRKVKILHNRSISYVKVRWADHSLEEASWEVEDEMKAKYPHLFDQPDAFLLYSEAVLGTGLVAAVRPREQMLSSLGPNVLLQSEGRGSRGE
ncbi:uncharacterized protein LOC122065080 [Macadamia integrifolia]|uniref:uncharacterized protein LOC122065080 n=1 Tax=Macadamia integrifolia TaxID=60698 RepID=UPI001C4F4E61|nr:uncharacterized protein LOC122065080 [Macadamia integrifolia]